MDTLDQKDSQSRNMEEKSQEVVENQLNKDENVVEAAETETVQPSETKSEKEEKQTEKSASADLENTPEEQVKDKSEPIESDEKQSEEVLSSEEPVKEEVATEDNADNIEEAEQPEEQPKEVLSVEESVKEEVAAEDNSDNIEKTKKPEASKEEPVIEKESEENKSEIADEEIDYAALSDEELVAKAKALIDGVIESYAGIKEKLDEIKQNFYKRLKQKQEDLKKAFLDAGGLEEDFAVEADALEGELKALLNLYKEKRNAEIQAIEKEKQDNLSAKNKILEELKALLENAEDFGKKVPAFQKLQQDWKTIGQVPAAEVTNLWKNYQLYVETFYDNLKINNELRDYDFRKNLEAKSSLCEQAEKLAEEADIVLAFRRLQVLHDEWRETGPVSRENRESIWERFKAASTIINKKHHDYFDKLREGEAENLVQKTALCEKVEAVTTDGLVTYKEWQEKTDEVITLQEEWKKIGFAPKKDNVAIYERFRTACDNFFQKKNAFYKAAKEVLVDNLTKKIQLCEKAEALKEDQNWKETADKLIQLQKDWKTIGPVPKKQSDVVWKRFISACDYFFDQKEKNFKSQKGEQESNLKRKKELIDQINALEVGDQNESFKTLKALIVEWNEVGHVPFKDKDKIYKEYKTAIDAQFDRLNMDQASRRMDFFRANLEDMAEKGPQKLLSERKRLMRVYEALNNDISTSENNIGFFSGSSKNAAGMIKDMERKIAKLKEERDLVIEKIKMLEDSTK